MVPVGKVSRSIDALLRIEGAERRVNFAAAKRHEKFESRLSRLPMIPSEGHHSRTISSSTNRLSSQEPSSRNDLVSAACPLATEVITYEHPIQ